MKKLLLILTCIISLFTLQAQQSNSSLSVSGKDTICPGDSTLLIVIDTPNSGTLLCSWSPSTGLNCVYCDSVYANPDTTTTYTIIVQGNHIDTTQVTVFVNGSGTGVSLSETGTICPFQGPDIVAHAVNGGTNPVYTWQLNGYNTLIKSDTLNYVQAQDTSPTWDDTLSAYLAVPPFYCLLTCQMISTVNGCIVTVVAPPDTFASYICGSGAGINSPELENQISISPNPNNGNFLLTFGQPSQQLNIELFNIQSERLYLEQLNDVPSLNQNFNFNYLAQGVYLLRVTTENGIAVKRIVIE